MSHATYTDEERLLKFDKTFFGSIIIVTILAIISFFINLITFFVSIIILSIFILLLREFRLLRSLKYLEKNKEYRIKPKMSMQIKESNASQIFTLILILLPLLALILAPIPINLSIALGFVGGWPLSNIIIQILILMLERRMRGKIYSVIVWEEIDNEVYVKEYGFVVK